MYFPSLFFVTLSKVKVTSWKACLLLLVLSQLMGACWFCFMTSYWNLLPSVLLPELLKCIGNHRNHWKWGIASLYALHSNVALSPTKAVAFIIGMTTGLAWVRSMCTKEKKRWSYYESIVEVMTSWRTLCIYMHNRLKECPKWNGHFFSSNSPWTVNVCESELHNHVKMK